MIEIHYGWLIALAVFAFMCGQIEEARQWRKRLKLESIEENKQNDKV